MQRKMLAAVQATAERLIAPQYLMGQMFERTGLLSQSYIRLGFREEVLVY